MKTKNKASDTTAKDKSRQKNIEEKLKNEKVELDHPRGKERFEKLIKRASKKKSTS